MYHFNFSLSLHPNDQDTELTFWELWQQNQDYLYGCCLKWMDNVADAEDALSRVMLKAWDKIGNSPVKIKNFKASELSRFSNATIPEK